MGDLTGRRMGGFRVVSEVRTGAGSQGSVYLGVCEEATMDGLSPGQEVALKVMPSSAGDAGVAEAMRRRTAALSRLSHPGIVRYYGCFTERDVFSETNVIVQEFLHGRTLKDELRRRPRGLDADEALRIVASVLEGLAHASENGVVHRDVKPGNVFLCDDGAVKLIDFEVASVEGEPAQTSTGGNLRGSFDYMAPEFVDESFAGDERSDVFSAGVVLHEALTGALPYAKPLNPSGGADFEFISRWSGLRDGGPSPVRVSTRVARLLARSEAVFAAALSPDRERRYRDFRSFLAGLREIRFRDVRSGSNTYRLLQFIGKGGFGEVFKARHRETGRFVAIKHLLKNEYAERFAREARVMSRLDGDCFVKLIDFFMIAQGGGREAFLVMDFLDGMPGQSLRDAIRKSSGRLDRGEVMQAFLRYAHGLAQMHRLGIFHRDIKPSNLYYPAGSPQRAAIMDLGIARDVNGTATTGQVPGTLDYMPPEVVTTSSRGDGGMDVFALGLCLYEALTGRMAYDKLPTGTRGYTEFFARARSLTPPRIDVAALGNDSALYSLIRDMTEPDVARRIRTAEVVERRLLALAGAGRAPAPPAPAAPTAAPQARPPRRPEAVRRPPPAARARPAPRASVPGPSAVPRAAKVGAVAAVGLVLAASVAFFLHPVVCERVARHQLDELLRLYDSDGGEAEGRASEEVWRSRWRPGASVWLRLPSGAYMTMLHTLESERERIALKWETAREKTDAMKRIEACLLLGGGVDFAGYDRIDGWSLPGRLEGDREVKGQIAALARTLSGAMPGLVAVEPLASRAERLARLRRVLDNSWTPRLLSEVARRKWEKEASAAGRLVAVRIVNEGTDSVQVQGRTVAANGGQTLLVVDRDAVRDVKVRRFGYSPIGLPGVSADGECRIADESFSSLEPVGLSVPSFGAGVECRIDGKAVPQGGVLSLFPGVHRCEYISAERYSFVNPSNGRAVSGPKYMAQAFDLTILPGRDSSLALPGAWRETDEFVRDRRLSEGWAKVPGRAVVPPLDAGVSCFIDSNAEPAYSGKVLQLSPGEHSFRYYRDGFHAQRGGFSVPAGGEVRIPSPGKWVSEREALRDQTLSRCRRLLALEPVGDRQERLEQAGRILADAVAFKRLFDEGEEPIRALDREIARLKALVVGKVVNKCRMQIAVGGRPVAPGATEVMVFEGGLPDDWSAEAKGFLRKPLLRDFDGLTLVFRDSDFYER